MERTVIKIAGESGRGLLSSGHIVSRALKDLGFYLNSDREYPSLIKGGSSVVQIDFGTKPIRSLSTKVDVVLCLDRAGLLDHLDSLKKGGIFIHGYERHERVPALKKKAQAKGIKVLYIPARTIALEQGGSELMLNMVLLGLLWKVLDLDLKILMKEVKHQFASKPKLLAIDLKCIKAGYNPKEHKNIPKFKIKHNKKKPNTLLIDGTKAISLGAIHAGLRNYYMYPMSPASGILTYIAATSHETGIVVKQAEDEITAVQMTIGSMHAGSRSMVATSGGGFDLMTESVSLVGITETPLVMVVGQRPGPGTGLPTWTCQGDLNLAINAGHGEFPRIVIGVSDQTSSFELMQHAFNLAEKYQTLVVVLTEKVVLETHTTIEPFKQKTIPINRHLVTKKAELDKLVPKDRFRYTPSGISKRWIPGSSKAYYYANSDEHLEDGVLNEDSAPSIKMVDKRFRKETTLLKELPEPKVFGAQKNAKISFVGWGSSKNVMLDVIEAYKKKGVAVNYLHYDYVFPIQKKGALKFFKENKNVHLIEGNYRGQLGVLIETATDKKFKKKLLKYDGRPFFFDEMMDYINKNIK
jgi:2-oxoglutarate ferredoxin oxidoreductase subunit alpha